MHFDRFEFYLNKLSILADVESSGYVNVQEDSFISAQNKFASSNGMIKIINDFIDRMWADTFTKAEKLKTEKGKQNRYDKFYETLKLYEERMSQLCIEHYKSLNENSKIKKPSIARKASNKNSSIANDTAYESWLNSYKNLYLDFDTWKSMAFGKYAEDPLEKYALCEKEIRPLWNEYFNRLKKIEHDWSQLHNARQYTGAYIDMFETACLRSIALYKEISRAETGHGETAPLNAPAFKRLAMLYEKQHLFEEACLVCEDALNHGANVEDMKKRLERLKTKVK